MEKILQPKQKMKLTLLILIVIIVCILQTVHNYCVHNKGCKAAHAELNERNQGIFSNEFSKRVSVGTAECCHPDKDTGCVRGSKEDLLLWIDCDTDSRKEKNYGQTIVACGACNITIRDNGMITVDETSGKTRAVYACKGIDAALGPSSRSGHDGL